MACAVTMVEMDVWDESAFAAIVIHSKPGVWNRVALSRRLSGKPRWDTIFEKGTDAVACLVHPDGSAGKRQIVGIKDVVQSILLAIGHPTAIGEAFNVSGPAPFSYDVFNKNTIVFESTLAGTGCCDAVVCIKPRLRHGNWKNSRRTTRWFSRTSES